MLHLLPDLILKVRESQKAMENAGRQLGELADYLEKLNPADIRTNPPQPSWRMK